MPKNLTQHHQKSDRDWAQSQVMPSGWQTAD